jgi:tripartite-type tricarboxylate transporter receptor subunit TctC
LPARPNFRRRSNRDSPISWRFLNGLLTPTGTPKAIVAQLAEATHTALADRDFQQMLIEAGLEPDLDSTPEKFRRSLEDDIARWTPVVKAIGLKID